MSSTTGMQAEVAAALPEVQRLKFQGVGLGWSPVLRQRYGYFTPDEWYEATVHQLVGPQTEWLDVGCGSDLFPSNPALGHLLAKRAKFLAGLDPSDNIQENPFVHEKAQCLLQDYRTERRFDLITMRMVAEHVSDPPTALAALARLTKPGGRVVIYTVDKWSPATLISAATPMAVHHAAKKWLWGTSPEDTFPVEYKMNTRATLARQFAEAGFAEESFQRLDDCRSFAKWPLTSRAELMVWKGLKAIGLGYPEACLLGLYRRLESAA